MTKSKIDELRSEYFRDGFNFKKARPFETTAGHLQAFCHEEWFAALSRPVVEPVTGLLDPLAETMSKVISGASTSDKEGDEMDDESEEESVNGDGEEVYAAAAGGDDYGDTDTDGESDGDSGSEPGDIEDLEESEVEAIHQL